MTILGLILAAPPFVLGPHEPEPADLDLFGPTRLAPPFVLGDADGD